MKVVVESSIPYIKGVLEPVADVEYVPSGQLTSERIRDADALIIRSITRCNERLLAGTNIKLICTATAGFDHIDTGYCRSRGISWRNSPGCNATAVGQYVIGCLAHLAIRMGEDLRGACIGIVGVGHVGRNVERFSRALGLEVLLCDPPRTEREGADSFVDIDCLLAKADIISLHVPLTREGKHPTYHLINRDTLAEAKRSPIVINACRGAVVDTQALIEARRSGGIRRLVIDCWENEPRINADLLQLSDIATPHIAGFSADGKSNGSRMCVENVRDYFHLGAIDTSLITPPPATNPIIDLSPLRSQRIWQAILKTFDPEPTDSFLRGYSDTFEQQRKEYHYPREMSGYTIVHASREECEILRYIDFKIATNEVPS